MKCLYVSGPLRATGPDATYGSFTPSVVRHNTEIARKWAEAAWLADWAVFCPHLNTLWMDGIGGGPTSMFIAGDIAWLSRMTPNHDAILMLPGWEHSKGSRLELEAARDRGLRVFFAADLNDPFDGPWPNHTAEVNLRRLCTTQKVEDINGSLG